jgi:hypothetical protein
VHTVEGEAFVDRNCVECGIRHLNYPGVKDSRCFACSNAKNPYAAKNIRFSIDPGPEDSTNPVRVAQGTAEFNLALPGVVEEWGPRNAYGQRTIKRKRPVSNAEIGSTRRLKEMAKKANMTPQETTKRAIGR